MRFICRYASLFALLLLAVPFACAQPTVDFGIGLGTTQVKSSGAGLSLSTFDSCTPNTGDSNCLRTPALKGFFLGFGGGVMLTKHYGFGAEVNFQPTKSDYAFLQYRQLFYDFNGIYAPIDHKRFMVRLQGGIGGAKTGFSFSQSSCVGTAICTSSSQSVGSSSHFQVHAGVGVDVFLTDYLFIRPQVDLHYVPNLTDQFGRDVAPRGTIWIGFSNHKH